MIEPFHLGGRFWARLRRLFNETMKCYFISGFESKCLSLEPWPFMPKVPEGFRYASCRSQSCSMMFLLRAPDDLLVFASYTQVQTYLSESQPAWDWDRLICVQQGRNGTEWERSSSSEAEKYTSLKLGILSSWMRVWFNPMLSSLKLMHLKQDGGRTEPLFNDVGVNFQIFFTSRNSSQYISIISTHAESKLLPL